MGLWIKIENPRGEELDLTSVSAHLAEFEGIAETEAKLITGARAYKLKTAWGEPPHVEYSAHSLCFYIHWSDNIEGHLQTLLKDFLKDNPELCGRCYDGYYHPDREAVQKFLEFAGLSPPHSRT